MLKDQDFEDLRDEIEDINDILMYFEDIFKSGIPKLTRALANSLLYYSYFPCLIGSLRLGSEKIDINSFSAAIFFLSQTFNYITEPSFINSIAIALFMPHIPQQFGKWISAQTKVPRSYVKEYSRKMTPSNLYRHTEERLSLSNIDLFINNNLSYLNEIQDEFKELKEIYRSSGGEDVDVDDSIEIKRKAIELIANRLKPKYASQILRYHTQLSIALGLPIGMMEKEAEYDQMSPTDFTKLYLDAMYNEFILFRHSDNAYETFVKHNHYQSNENSSVLLNFLRSKDDSFVLLIGSLLYTFLNSDAVDPPIHYFSKMYPIGLITSKKPEDLSEDSEEVKEFSGYNEENVKSDRSGNINERKEYNERHLEEYKEPKYEDDIVSMLLNLISTDPPFRLITFKFLAILVDNL